MEDTLLLALLNNFQFEKSAVQYYLLPRLTHLDLFTGIPSIPVHVTASDIAGHEAR